MYFGVQVIVLPLLVDISWLSPLVHLAVRLHEQQHPQDNVLVTWHPPRVDSPSDYATNEVRVEVPDGPPLGGQHYMFRNQRLRQHYR